MLTHELARKLLSMPNREIDIELIVHGGTFDTNEDDPTNEIAVVKDEGFCDGRLSHQFDGAPYCRVCGTKNTKHRSGQYKKVG
jgi:hypothetical protein